MTITPAINFAMPANSLLLVDDDIDAQDIFRTALSEVAQSIVFHTASNGEEALRQLENSSAYPDIIFLDEPLSGLDANAVILVKEILAQLKQAGKTIFYSSHIMDVVEKISDRIIIINKGEVIADGTFEALKSNAHLGSLETIFTALTGDEQHQDTAGEFVNILQN